MRARSTFAEAIAHADAIACGNPEQLSSWQQDSSLPVLLRRRPAGRRRCAAAGSIIIVVATDAPLLPHQLERIARRAPWSGMSGAERLAWSRSRTLRS